MIELTPRHRTPSALFAPLCALLLAVMWGVPALAQVGVSPPIMEMRLDEPAGVQSVRLHSFDDKERRVRVSVVNWTMDEQGNVVVLPPSETSLDKWVIVSPLEFVLKGHSAQTVRVAVRPPVTLAPGEHRAMVYFDEILPQTERKSMRGRFRIGAALYANQGAPVRVGRIADIAVTNSVLTAKITSTGQSYVRLGGQATIWRAEAFPGLENSPMATPQRANAPLPAGVVAVQELPTVAVLPGLTRSFSLPLAVPPGSYVLEYRGTLSGETTVRAIPFTSTTPVRK